MKSLLLRKFVAVCAFAYSVSASAKFGERTSRRAVPFFASNPKARQTAAPTDEGPPAARDGSTRRVEGVPGRRRAPFDDDFEFDDFDDFDDFNFSHRRDDCKVDVVFMVDSSTGVDWEFVKNITTTTIASVALARPAARVGVVMYSDAVAPIFLDDAAAVSAAVSAAAQLLGERRADVALEFAHRMMFDPHRGARPDAQRLLVVIGDGRTARPDATRAAAARWTARPAQRVVCLDVRRGDAVNDTRTELAALCSTPFEKYYYQSPPLGGARLGVDFAQAAAASVDELCAPSRAAALRQTGGVATDKPCANEPIDVVFLLDSSTDEDDRMLGYWEVKGRTAVIIIRLNQYTKGTTNYGIVQYATESVTVANLGDGRVRVLKTLRDSKPYHAQGITNTHLAINEAKNQFTKGRKGATQILMILTDGHSSDSNATLSAMESLKNEFPLMLVYSIGVATNTDDNNDTEMRRMCSDLQTTVDLEEHRQCYFNQDDIGENGFFDSLNDVVDNYCPDEPTTTVEPATTEEAISSLTDNTTTETTIPSSAEERTTTKESTTTEETNSSLTDNTTTETTIPPSVTSEEPRTTKESTT
eukprot:Selendium_serpulae@DN5081_c0_g1_i20.p1